MNKHQHKLPLMAAATLMVSAVFNTVWANGAIGDHVNDLKSHIDQYTEEVHWLLGKVDAMIATYSEKGAEAAHSDAIVEHWEAVDVHAAIETNFIPVYASIWQGLYGVKTAIDNQAAPAEVMAERQKLAQSLWQGLGAVRLAAQYQEKGLVAEIHTTEKEPTTPTETVDDIIQRLDKVVAKAAEQLSDAANTIVQDTYLHRFEGIEGMLIEKDAELVVDLEKDFNVTLPQAIAKSGDVDQVRTVVEAMKNKLDRAKTLLMEIEKERKDVF